MALRNNSSRGAETHVYDVRSYGAIGDGVTDDSNAVQECINACYAGGGGRITGYGIFRCNSQLSIPFALADGQRTVEFFGSDASANFATGVSEPTTGFMLDLRYTGTGAKMVALGGGILSLRGVRIGCLDSTKDTTPLLLVTIPQPRISSCTFFGNTTNTTTNCNQDAIVLGGTKPYPIHENDVLSAFAGYGGFIRENSFHNIRRAVTMQSGCNGVNFVGNCIEAGCGSSETNSAPIVLDPSASDGTHHTTGNVIRDNTIEVTNYNYGVRINNASDRNLIIGNGFWDQQNGVTAGDVWVDSTNAVKNRIILNGYTNTEVVTGAGGSSAGSGNQWVETFSSRYCAETFEYKPASWKMYLNGDVNDSHWIAYDAANDGPLISGFAGVGIRSKGASGGAQKTSLRVGSGSPEGVVTASPGSVYFNVAGGAGTSFYVKESGTGNTGWIGK